MKVTDTLSRTELQDNTPEINDKDINNFVYFEMSPLPTSERTRQKQVTESAKDDTLQKIHQISAELPEHRLKRNPCLRSYHHHNSVVTYKDGLLLNKS